MVINPAIPEPEVVKAALQKTLDLLYVNEFDKILQGGKENYLNGKLRDFLKPIFPEWEVKCEKRTEGDVLKRNSSGKVVRPDVVIHKPGKSGPNIVIIEAKGYWNRTNRELDRDKLKDYAKTQGYKYAYQVEYGKDRAIFSRITN